MQGKQVNIAVHIALTIIAFIMYGLSMGNLYALPENTLCVLLVVVFLWNLFSLPVYEVKWISPYSLFLIIFFIYNASGFVFCMFSGYSLFDETFHNSTGMFSLFTKQETLYAVLFFLLFSQWGVILYSRLHKENNASETTVLQEDELRQYNLWIGVILFVCTLPLAYYYYFSVCKEAFLMGGYQNYTNSISDRVGTESMPLFIRISDDIFAFSFALLLSAKPKRKYVWIPILLYILPFIALSFFTGSRVHAIKEGVMLLCVYAILYNVNTRRIIAMGVAILAFALVVTLTRTNEDYDISQGREHFESSTGLLNKFFLQQGMTAHTIAMTINLHEQGKLPYSVKYFFAPFYEQSGYAKGHAYDDYDRVGNKLAYMYSRSFEEGSGLGSSCVAELYALGGMWNVMVGAVLLSLIVLWLTGYILEKGKCIWYAFLILILPGIFYLARAELLYPLEGNKIALLLLLVYWLTMNLIRRKEKTKI